MLKLKNIFENIPENLEDENFEKIIRSENVVIERIVSKGHTSPENGWYDQEQNEWVLLLKGQAKILFSTDETLELKEGDYVLIPAHKKHKVIWTDPATESIWLAVHYSTN
ncbi:MAG: cupin [Planctomycetota bacterium]|nr:MAG: cupin [Planctomycetota bacterium]